MKKLLLVVAACLFIFGVANAQDPGLQDSVIIQTVDVAPGTDSIYVWIWSFTDDSVAFYNMPMTFTASGSGINFEHMSYYPPLTLWEETFDSLLVPEGFLRMVAWNDLGGPETEPPLNTNGVRHHTWNIVFSVDPGADDPQVVDIDTTYDPVNGEFIFGLVGGVVQFTPAFVPGAIHYGVLGTDDDPLDIPTEFALKQNYPNPFNPSTNMLFDLPKAQNVTLEVFNILGQHVKTLANGMYEAGSYTVSWNGTNGNGEDVPSGIYFYSLRTEEFSKTNKMMLIR